ncbi:MAG: histidine phosphatase family protein [Marinobacterium sp.]|nr:histidine phosphatase family protein [Marinobacterium sp.]
MNPEYVPERTLWLLRHGETTAGRAYIGRSDPPLTPQGWQQMEYALQSAPDWQQVLSSPRQRCRTFARELAKRLSLPLQVQDAFAEYDFGVMEGLTAQQVLDQHPGVLDAFWQDPAGSPPPGAEPLAAFETRLRSGLQQIDFSQGPVLLVCHGGVIRALRCLEQGQPVSQLLQYSAPHGELYPLSLPMWC